MVNYARICQLHLKHWEILSLFGILLVSYLRGYKMILKDSLQWQCEVHFFYITYCTTTTSIYAWSDASSLIKVIGETERVRIMKLVSLNRALFRRTTRDTMSQFFWNNAVKELFVIFNFIIMKFNGHFLYGDRSEK